MAIDLETLGKRLRQARESCGLTQKQAADKVGLHRPAIVRIEAGKREISTLELMGLAELYQRPIMEFLSADSTVGESEQAITHFRVSEAFRDAPQARKQVERWFPVCQEGRELEQLLGASRRNRLPTYALHEPRTNAEAFTQGAEIAEQERKRIGLSDAPVHRLQDLLSSEGIWAAGVNLPDEMSGLFINHPSVGIVILVNHKHARVRVRFSYAHEYGHALMDRSRKTLVSTRQNAVDRTEKRADAFAAAFLMPESGVRSFFASRDKGGASRLVHAVFGVAGASEETEERTPPGSQKIVYQDVALLARYFGVSYQATVFRLQDIGIINRESRQALLNQKGDADRFLSVLRFTGATDIPKKVDEPEETNELVSQVVYHAIEAYRRKRITQGRLYDLGRRLPDISGQELVELAEAAV